MSNINIIIPQFRFDLIADRLASIIALELNYQTAVSYDDTIDAKVFIERSIPIDASELPLVNVAFAGADYDNKKQTSKDGSYTFEIDVYTKSKTDATEMADKKSIKALQRILGIINYVLEHPAYKTLDFAPGFIATTLVQSIKIQDPKGAKDADSIKMGRISFFVRVCETTTDQPTTNVSSLNTQVQIAESDQGYFYEVVNS
jgi:hypothetical protein